MLADPDVFYHLLTSNVDLDFMQLEYCADETKSWACIAIVFNIFSWSFQFFCLKSECPSPSSDRQ